MKQVIEVNPEELQLVVVCPNCGTEVIIGEGVEFIRGGQCSCCGYDLVGRPSPHLRGVWEAFLALKRELQAFKGRLRVKAP